MCGIVGFTGKRNVSELNKLLSYIVHRGRDEKITFIRNRVHFGMNRLAILDLTSNLYPMKYKHLRMVFNGEIYNYRELRQKLTDSGVVFHSNSDAEVILPLYYLYGSKAFEKLEGMFAISIYDQKNEEIILARDKSGEKPLYFTILSDELYFASEMKVLLSLSHLKKKLNTKKFYEYFAHGFVRSPYTLVQSVQKLSPSSFLRFSLRTRILEIKTYWNISVHQELEHGINGSRRNILDNLLDDSVKQRLIADVPIGCFLSGGVDSSLIALYAKKYSPDIRTYSIAFPEFDHYDESVYSRFIAKELQTNHTQVNCTSDSVLPMVQDIGSLIDEPIVDPAFLATLLLAKEARKQVKVVLTGDGADELFAGYKRYSYELGRESIHQIITATERSMIVFNKIFGSQKKITRSLLDRYSPQRVWNDEVFSALTNVKIPKYTKKITNISPLVSLQIADYRGYLADQLLNKIDRSSMAANLEARAPFLDSRIVKFAFSLSDKEKIYLGKEKIILKKVAEKYFSKRFVWRKKHGFHIPLSLWLKHALKIYAYESLEYAGEFPELFHYDTYKSILTDHMNGSSDNANKIWSMIVLTRWMNTHHITS